VLQVKNSWRTAFGKNGYGTIHHAYLTDSSLSDDYWMIRISSRLGNRATATNHREGPEQ
jgi:C1A family cysteine protease